MSLENLIEIQTLTEEKILEVMRSKKMKPEVQADIGLKYIKTITSNEMQKLGAIIQVAGLYTPERREEIAKKIIPPMSNIIDPNIQVITGQEYKKFFDSMNQMKHEHAEMGKRVEQKEAEKQKLVNVIADLKDDKNTKEAPSLAESIKKDYQLKRDY